MGGQLLETHAHDHAWHAKHLDLFIIWDTWHPAHYERRPGPLISHVGSPGVIGQPGGCANIPMTPKEVRNP
jgi:hypothetical protein